MEIRLPYLLHILQHACKMANKNVRIAMKRVFVFFPLSHSHSLSLSHQCCVRAIMFYRNIFVLCAFILLLPSSVMLVMPCCHCIISNDERLSINHRSCLVRSFAFTLCFFFFFVSRMRCCCEYENDIVLEANHLQSSLELDDSLVPLASPHSY